MTVGLSGGMFSIEVLPLTSASVMAGVCKHDYAKSLQEILMRRCRIVCNCCEKIRLDVVVDAAENGRIATIFAFRIFFIHIR